MAILHIEKLGGLGGFGGTKSHLKSRGEIDTTKLSSTDRKAVDSLFQANDSNNKSNGGDEFRFRISRATKSGVETIEVPETHIPVALASSVKDELV